MMVSLSAPDMAGVRTKWMGLESVLAGDMPLESSPELENSPSLNDDSANDFFVLTRSKTIVGYAPWTYK